MLLLSHNFKASAQGYKMQKMQSIL